MWPMSTHTAAAAAEDRPGSAESPSSWLDAAWAHPVLGRLLRGQNQLRGMDRRRPWLFDTVVVLAVAGGGLPELVAGEDAGPLGDRADLPGAVLFGFTVALVVPLWWRRRAPAVTFFVIAAVALALWSRGASMQESPSLAVALYSLALRGSLRTLGWAAALLFVELSVAVCFPLSVEHRLVVLVLLFGNATASRSPASYAPRRTSSSGTFTPRDRGQGTGWCSRWRARTRGTSRTTTS